MSTNTARILISVAISLITRIPTARADENAAAEFLASYPSAANKLETTYNTVKGNCILTKTSGPGQIQTVRRRLALFAVSSGLRKVMLTEDGPKDPKFVVVQCVGKELAFGLHKPPNSSQFSLHRTNSERKIVAGLYSATMGKYIEAPYRVFGVTFGEILKRPDFKLSAVDKVTLKGRTLVRVKCEARTAGKLSRYSVTLDPSQGWVITHCECEPGLLPGATIIYEVEYGSSASGIVVPKEVRYKDFTGENCVCVFQSVAFVPTPIDEFTPDYYGIGSIPPAENGSVRAFHFILLIGFAFVGLLSAWLLKRRIRATNNV